jgi:hypothetical protein
MTMSEREWLAAGREPWVSGVNTTTVEEEWGAYRIDRLEIIKTHSVGYRTAKYVKRSTYEYEVLRQTCSHEPLWFTSWGPYDSLEHARRVAAKLQDLDRQKDVL